MTNDQVSSPFSRRNFLQASSAALAYGMLSEPLLAQVARGQVAFPDGAIRINANENPLGPCKAAREAVIAITPEGGRYHFNLTEELVKTFADQQGLKPELVMPFPGSTPGLYYTVAAFTSPRAASRRYKRPRSRGWVSRAGSRSRGSSPSASSRT